MIRRDGTIVKGLDGVRELYDAVGLGWVMQLAKLPILGEVAEVLYKVISKNRMQIAGGMDAGAAPLVPVHPRCCPPPPSLTRSLYLLPSQ